MSVASNTESPSVFHSWYRLTDLAPLPPPGTESREWAWQSEDAARSARAAIWAAGDNSNDRIWNECFEALKRNDPDNGEKPFQGIMTWHAVIVNALRKDSTVTCLPTSKGINTAVARLHEWWTQYWNQVDKTDLEKVLCQADHLAESLLADGPNNTDADLARLLWIEDLRTQFPGHALTFEERAKARHRRRVLAIGSEAASGLSEQAKQHFVDALEDFAAGQLVIPVNGDAVEEAWLAKDMCVAGLTAIETSGVMAALLRTAAALEAERCRSTNTLIHPVAGYAMKAQRSEKHAPCKLESVAPGHWRLRIEGEQYVISCELWPRPVVMSHNEFGRARGSANAILRDVGISVDSPPGHWKKVWETCGLRNQLLAAAERIDPRLRLEQVWLWMRGIAAAAPAAHRPAIDGSAVRLADGATVADPRWLVERALEDGVILPHEEAGLEKEIRRRTRETNRRDAAQRQRKFVVLEADAGPAGNLLSSKGPRVDRKNDEER